MGWEYGRWQSADTDFSGKVPLDTVCKWQRGKDGIAGKHPRNDV